MHKRKRAGNTITRKINSTKDTAAKADKNHYISNSYLEGFIPIDTEYFTASFKFIHMIRSTTKLIKNKISSVYFFDFFSSITPLFRKIPKSKTSQNKCPERPCSALRRSESYTVAID